MGYFGVNILDPQRSPWQAKMQLAEWARVRGFTPAAYVTHGNYIRLYVR